MNRKTFWVIIAIIHALFFIKQMFVYNSLLQDSLEYLYAADNLINKATLYAWNMNYAFNADWLTKRPFLYPSILVLLKSITFHSEFGFFFLTYLIQNLISLFNIRLCFKIAEKFNPKFSYLKAFIFFLFSVSQIIYANLIMSEIWLQLSFIGIAYLLIMKPNNALNLFVISLLLIAAMSLKPVAMPAAFLFPVLMLIRFKKQIRFSHFSLSLLPLLFVFFCSYLNAQRTGYFQYSSISTINLLHYNTYVTLMNLYGTEKADSMIDQIKLETRGMSYANKQKHIESSCKKILRSNWPTYTYLHIRGIAFALFDPGRFDLTQFFRLPHKTNLIYQTNQKGMTGTIIRSFLNPLGFILILILLFNAFRLIKVLDFIRRKNYSIPLKIMVLILPAYILMLTGPIGTSRFFMPLIPFAFIIFLLTTNKKTNEAHSPNSPIN